jgi:hypothetical protein
MKFTLGALLLVLAPVAANGDEAVTVMKNARGEKVYRFTKGLEFDVRAQAPRVSYYLQRSRVEYSPPETQLQLLDKIHLATTKPPF